MFDDLGHSETPFVEKSNRKTVIENRVALKNPLVMSGSCPKTRFTISLKTSCRAFLLKTKSHPGGRNALKSSTYDLQQRIIELEQRVNTLQSQVEQLLSIRDSSLSRKGQLRKFVQQLPLTHRERKVVVEFLALLSDKKTASRLGRSVQTVRNQMNSVQKKLGLKSRQELVSAMLSRGTTKFRN
ncbi:MAG: LuxR C-terminal-related transcriptional regulator [Planctomycetes bacterium]|nr:LuxR C-terminal-related transcriptional regulator [Planctomycetota bacterium]